MDPARSLDCHMTGPHNVAHEVPSRDELRRCIGVDEMIRRSAASWPENTAVVSGGERWSYAEFDAGVNSLAQRLTELQLSGNAHCAVLLDHGVGVGAIVAFFAVQRAGFVVAQTNSNLSGFEVEQQFRHGDIVAAVVSPDQIPKLAWIRDGSRIRHLIVLREPHNADIELPTVPRQPLLDSWT